MTVERGFVKIHGHPNPSPSPPSLLGGEVLSPRREPACRRAGI